MCSSDLAAWETLRAVAADPKHLGARIGMLAVLHTWGQNLMHHPHVHCVVPGGGLSPCGTRWVPSKRSCRGKPFFLPVRVLSRVFRGKFIAMLKQAYRDGELTFHGRLLGLASVDEFESLIDRSVIKEWVVYCKRPFGSPEQVLKYLARYTHRVAIANSRLLDMNDGQVRFRWKNYARNNEWSTMALDGCEFIRRFLLHVLPSGFVRIRHFGLLANRRRSDDLETCRQLLGVKERSENSEYDVEHDGGAHDAAESTEDAECCPRCKAGMMRLVETLEPATTARWTSINRSVPSCRPP